MKIAVISDIHAFEAATDARRFADNDRSWTRTVPDEFESKKAPFPSLIDLIKTQSLDADVLVSCGDMGDRASHAGAVYAWSYLETVRRRLGSRLIAVTGNHDVDSRDISGRDDPKYITRGLQPPFPVDDEEALTNYWAKHVATVRVEDTDFVLVNSAADHDDTETADRGRVSDATLDCIRDHVKAATAPNRVLLVHHHPYRHDAIDRTDYSEMDGGPEILRMLQDDGDWLVIHGHRHYPNLVYAAGGNQAPVIFAAGSFSARIYPELQGRVRNQFYILDLSEPHTVPGTAGMTGAIRAWEWTSSKGWVQPSSPEGIPDSCGFGCRTDPNQVADLLYNWIDLHRSGFSPLSAPYEQHPELKYLVPVDRAAALDLLQNRGVRVSPREHFSSSIDEVFLSFDGGQ